MTPRQKTVLDRMTDAMAAQFEANVWRESTSFPSLSELAARAHRSLSRAYGHAQIGAELEAVQHAAAAANLIGLAVLYGADPVLQQPAYCEGAEVRP